MGDGGLPRTAVHNGDNQRRYYHSGIMLMKWGQAPTANRFMLSFSVMLPLTIALRSRSLATNPGAFYIDSGDIACFPYLLFILYNSFSKIVASSSSILQSGRN
ncbi:Protein of unknown function [Pyronema omphalodes CBS 100304]|uniref:Uncharacterized protein n=1 Tax=Pyronema omphalodes (strain CBS 100304) TaxID=1076935 RepID=U4LUC3_PYROM|nr:Protein of unknown function [Pyronema omphalodes CBS 100304]